MASFSHPWICTKLIFLGNSHPKWQHLATSTIVSNDSRLFAHRCMVSVYTQTVVTTTDEVNKPLPSTSSIDHTKQWLACCGEFFHVQTCVGKNGSREPYHIPFSMICHLYDRTCYGQPSPAKFSSVS